MAEIIDSNGTGAAGGPLYAGVVSGYLKGQSFTCGGNFILASAKFYLYKTGSPTGSVYAKLWSHSGTYGSSSIGATLLATSAALNVATLTTTPTQKTFTFSGAEAINLSAGYYVVSLEYNGGNGTNCAFVYLSTSDVHGGNECYFTDSWAYNASWDLRFEVLGDPVSNRRNNLMLLGVG
jgi:hypothetical protein